MTDHEIEMVASSILRRRLHAFGFQGVEARSEIDFDGSPVIRVKARYTDESAPTKAITQSLHDIRSELINRGEDRFVLLEGEYLGNQPVDEDVE
jgi:hypothetical protein